VTPSISDYVRAQHCPRCGARPGEVCRSLVLRRARPRAHGRRQDAGARQYRLAVVRAYLDQAGRSS